jgi:MSHA type pilus biogenesis protein MshL
MNAVKKIVDNYETILGGQILIDAQIIEVALTDQFQFGVDWSSVRDNVALVLSPGQRTISSLTSNFGDLSQNQGTRSFTISPSVVGGAVDNLFSAQGVSDELAATISMMQGYGDVSVLSNPTIRSKHGQPAIISVGTSTSYISNTRVVINGGTGGGSVTSQEIETAQVFDGLMIGVVPFIDSKGGISLSVHPVQSKVNPNSLALVDAGGTSRVTLPVVNLKSLVTQLKVKSGDVVILGGLIDQVDDRQESGVPGLSSLPFIGNLFKKRANINRVRELVILMKVTRI